MGRPRFSSIRVRISAGVSVILLLSMGSLVGVVSARTQGMARDQAGDLVSELSRSHSSVVEHRVGAGLAIARQLATTFRAMRSAGTTDRDAYNAVLRAVLAQEKQYLAAWTLWEPDALDGRDAEYAGTEGHDATGRFIPYWNRAGGEIRREPLVDYDQPGAGDYYLVPKRMKAEKVLEPYAYAIGGKDVLMTSVVVPIMRSGRFLGVAGLDIALDDLGEAISQIRPHGGYAALVSTAGAFVAHPEPGTVGQPVGDPRLASVVRAAASSTDPVSLGADGSGTVGATLQAWTAVPLGENDTWVFGVAVPLDAVLAGSRSLRAETLTFMVVCLGLGMAVVLLVSRSLTLPLRRLQLRMEEIAHGEGDLRQRVEIRREDEIGAVAHAFNLFAEKISGALVAVGECAHRVATGSDDLSVLARQMNDTAGQAKERIQVLDTATGEVSANVSMVAASSEEMNSTIGEVAQRAAEAARIAGAAVEAADSTGGTMTRLEAAGVQIDDIVRTIDSFADQTNLLSLNATIEAARAGESGKGFAVVAGEVKELARQTAEATADIAATVGTMKETSGAATEALGRISQIIGQVNDLQAAIAAAVEQQSATSGEISRSVTDLSEESRRIAETVAEVAEAAGTTSTAAEQTLRSAEDMSGIASDLQQLLGAFRY